MTAAAWGVWDRGGAPARPFRITDDESAACSAILKFRGRVEDDVRDLARAASRRCAEADRDCAAHAVHAVVWRDLAIAARAREAALTAEVERLRDDAANARAVATEAIEIADSLVTIAKRGYVLQGRVANLATLRARLASPEPAKENQ